MRPSLAGKSKGLTVQRGSDSYKVHVDLGERSYDILVEPGVLDRLGSEIRDRVAGGSANGRTAIVLTNPKIDLYHGDRATRSLEDAGFRLLRVTITAGESYKTLQTVRRIYKFLYEATVDRHAILVALGGGVIGDIGGFVAATYNRGLDFVQVPTTLLAQVDSSVGGKTGVNFARGKNLIGAFYQPRLVAIDPLSLRSLSMRERRSGLAEVVKYGIIYDEAFFALLEQELTCLLRLRSNDLSYCIARSCEIKARVVEQDEMDNGLRAILNFGHTIGHAIESVTRYRVYRHGEAISIGMVSASLIGELIGTTSYDVTERIVSFFRSAGFPVAMQSRISIDEVIGLLGWDKKSVDGCARFVMLHRIGAATAGHRVGNDVIRRALLRQQSEYGDL